MARISDSGGMGRAPAISFSPWTARVADTYPEPGRRCQNQNGFRLTCPRNSAFQRCEQRPVQRDRARSKGPAMRGDRVSAEPEPRRDLSASARFCRQIGF